MEYFTTFHWFFHAVFLWNWKWKTFLWFFDIIIQSCSFELNKLLVSDTYRTWKETTYCVIWTEVILLFKVKESTNGNQMYEKVKSLIYIAYGKLQNNFKGSLNSSVIILNKKCQDPSVTIEWSLISL